MRAAKATHVSVLLAALMASPASAGSRFDLPQGPGRDLVYGNCQTCHDLQSVVDSAGIRKGAWGAVLDNMTQFGLRLDDDQKQRILDYLGTYLGPNPPPEEPVQTAKADRSADGASVFADTCRACHQDDGKGKAGEFPPLAGNADIFLSKDFPASVVINGLEGKLTVEGEAYDKVMPSFDFLSDDQIAAVIGYVRSSWGNADMRPDGVGDPSAEDVAAVREKSMSASDVHDLRASLKEKKGSP